MFSSCPLLRFHFETSKMRKIEGGGDSATISIDFEEDLEGVLQTILPDRYPFVCQKTDKLLSKILEGDEKENEEEKEKKGKKFGKKNKGKKSSELNKVEIKEEVLCEFVTGEMVCDVLLPAMVNVGFLKIS